MRSARLPSSMAALAAALTLLLTLVAPAASGESSVEGFRGGDRSGLVVRTDAGPAEGSAEDGYRLFQGIPFAAPPTGDRRFEPPAPVEPWTDVLDATAPGDVCPQFAPGGGPLVGDEDCLYLNVTVPDGRGRSHHRRNLPVMVWIHGGSFLTGSGSAYDASKLATRGDVVVVTVNYRLGPLGFLAHPGTGENPALADQQAALGWVEDNIRAFGGNPNRVTVFGESAGAAAVCANVAAPGSAGLFRRAIAQSYSCTSEYATVAEGEAVGVDYAASVDCDQADPAAAAACLRGTEVATLLGAWGGGAFVVGGPTLPAQPGDALADGSANRVDLMHGNTRDENRLFVPLNDPTVLTLTPEGYEERITATFGPAAPAVLGLYPVDAYESPAIALSTVFSDFGNVLATCSHLDAYATADASRSVRKLYTYQFRDRTADPLVDFPGFDEGAEHATELPYLFPGLFGDGLTPEQEVLSDAMVDYWTSFATNGRPSVRGLPRWSPSSGDGTVLGLDLDSAGGIGAVDVGAESNCDFWSAFG